MAKSLNIRPEVEIQSDIIKALQKIGIWVLRLGVSSKRGRGGTNSGEKGMPDILLPAVAGGSWLEVKNLNGKLSAVQKEWHEKAKGLGINVAVVHDIPESVTVVKQWQENYPVKAAA